METGNHDVDVKLRMKFNPQQIAGKLNKLQQYFF